MRYQINRNRIRELETEIRLYDLIVKRGLPSPKDIEAFATAKIRFEECRLEYKERTGQEYSERIKGRWDA